MALLVLDPKALTLEARVGILEKYSPDKDIKNIHKKVEALRKLTHETLGNIIGESKSQGEILEILKGDPDKAAQWKKFIDDVYVEKMREISKDIKKKNIEICPNFKKHIKV